MNGACRAADEIADDDAAWRAQYQEQYAGVPPWRWPHFKHERRQPTQAIRVMAEPDPTSATAAKQARARQGKLRPKLLALAATASYNPGEAAVALAKLRALDERVAAIVSRARDHWRLRWIFLSQGDAGHVCAWTCVAGTWTCTGDWNHRGPGCRATWRPGVRP
jgi:hypothetical protein